MLVVLYAELAITGTAYMNAMHTQTYKSMYRKTDPDKHYQL